MTFYRVLPDPRIALDDGDSDDVALMTDHYRVDGALSVRVNMVVSPTGSTTGPDGTSGSLSSPADRVLVTLLRGLADAVIIGAETLRRERIPLPEGIPLVVLSRSGHIAANNLITTARHTRLVVVTQASGQAQKSLGGFLADIINPGDGFPSPEALLTLLRDNGWNHLLIEGGRQTATLFAEAGLVDDLCLTLTGAPLEEATPPVSWWPTTDTWELRHLFTDDHRMLYHRLSRPTGPRP